MYDDMELSRCILIETEKDKDFIARDRGWENGKQMEEDLGEDLLGKYMALQYVPTDGDPEGDDELTGVLTLVGAGKTIDFCGGAGGRYICSIEPVVVFVDGEGKLWMTLPE